MRSLLFALVGTTALIPTFALAQSTNDQNASLADCDRLISRLEQQNPPNSGVTVDQAKKYKADNNATACHEALARIEATGGTAAKQQERVIVQEQAPKVQVQQAPAQVNVTEPKAHVTVKEGVPEITIRQPAPTVTVNIPEPEITVRMPKPGVNVAMAQPQIEVNQPKPKVEIAPTPQPQVQVQPVQPNVTIQQATSQPSVTTEEAQTPPHINYQQEQPKVVIHQPQGQPQVHVEQMNAPPSSANPTPSEHANAQAPQTNAQPPQQSNAAKTAAVSAAKPQGEQVPVSQLLKLKIKDASGKELGTVDRVVSNTADGKRYIIMGQGGFLGLGEKEVALPLEDLSLRNTNNNNELITRNISDDQIRAMPAWDKNNQNYHDLQGNQTVQISQG